MKTNYKYLEGSGFALMLSVLPQPYAQAQNVSSFLLTQTTTGTVASVDEPVSSNTADAAFRLDSSNQQWIFNISTNGLTSNTAYAYTINLNDGTALNFRYGVK